MFALDRPAVYDVIMIFYNLYDVIIILCHLPVFNLCSLLLNVTEDASVLSEVRNVAGLWFRIQIHIQLDLSGQKHLSTEISFF